MKIYIGCELIEAKPMTRGNYNRLRGWDTPKDEVPSDEGYIVKHGYDRMSWIPKNEFEKHHYELEIDKDEISDILSFEYEYIDIINKFKGIKFNDGNRFGYLLGGTYDISELAENENQVKEKIKEQDWISIDIFHALLEFAFYGFNYRKGEKQHEKN